ncbi:hypothetical protein ACJMK2_024357 [Sinanodonta woodiana]|uniref:Uncharacterized protein n=1 Tax=Sinanodonta woodiana TaxID=1069815 RepID=A0ABD3T8Z5_SINWO
MKGIIILAITSFLVGVQASSIYKVQKELDVDKFQRVESPWILEELDSTSANGALAEMQNMKTIVDVLHFLQNYKDVTRCSGNSCKWCKWSVCFKITYLPESNMFQFCAVYRNINVYCRSVPSRSFKYCKTVRIKFFFSTLCIEATNVRISGGRACLDLKLSVSGIPITFRNLCIGTSNYFNSV